MQVVRALSKDIRGGVQGVKVAAMGCQASIATFWHMQACKRGGAGIV